MTSAGDFDDVALDIEVGSDGKVLADVDECTVVSDESASVVTLPPESFGVETSTGRRGRRWLVLSVVALAAIAAFFCVGFFATHRPSRSSEMSQIVSSENANVEEESPEDSEADTEDSEADTGIFFSNDESEVPASNDEVEDCTRFLFMDIDADLLTRDALGFDDDGVEEEDEAEEEEEVFSTNSINDEGSDATESSSEKRRRCENLVRRLSQRED